MTKSVDKLAKLMADKNFDSIIVMACGFVGLASLFLPWFVLRGGYDTSSGRRLLVDNCYSLIEMWTPDFRQYDLGWYSILALIPTISILCVVTPIITKHGRKFIRAPLYAFYVFVATLTLSGFHSWVKEPVIKPPEAWIYKGVGVGYKVFTVAIIGVLVATVVAYLVSKPRFTSRSVLLVGVISGIFVELSFFYFDWVTIWHWRPWYDGIRSGGVTGLQIAFNNFYVAFDIFDLSSQNKYHGLNFLIPIALYLVPIVGALLIVSPFFHPPPNTQNLNAGKVVRFGSGVVLLGVIFFFLTKGRFSEPYYDGSGHMPALGMWFVLAIGLFLITSELLRPMKDVLIRITSNMK